MEHILHDKNCSGCCGDTGKEKINSCSQGVCILVKGKDDEKASTHVLCQQRQVIKENSTEQWSKEK